MGSDFDLAELDQWDGATSQGVRVTEIMKRMEGSRFLRKQARKREQV